VARRCSAKSRSTSIVAAPRLAAAARECGVPLMVGFNRRFDPNFARLERQIRDGRIGYVELLTSSGRIA
jgi:myo-inositol 2-dehydrogenase / D-chiro-inositol 1-dehydrogenase